MSHRIVIAEDETVLRQNLARLLRMEGYEVLTGSNGMEALELVKEHLPDLVLSDVMMPEMTGHQLVAAVRADPHTAHVPLVLLTARADHRDVREGMNLGADDYLTKPFQRDELLSCIRAQLDKASNQKLASRRLAVQAHRISHYDAITDLPNRAHFVLLLRNALAAAQIPGVTQGISGCALWIVGMDNLPQLGEVLGRGQLDNAIQQLAQRLTGLSAQTQLAMGAPCTVARLGEDRLAVLAAAWPQGQALETATSFLLEAMGLPLKLEDEEHFPSVSVGACEADSPDITAEALINRLEMSLAVARSKPGQRQAVYRQDAAPELSASMRLHNDLHRALNRNELKAYFQPQVCATNGIVRGFEALMRWEHPQQGLVSPARFIPLAEDNGQIVHLGAWMLQQACAQARSWQQNRPATAHPLRVAVNLSARQFADPDLLDHVQQALDMANLPASLLELEITEGTAMHDLQRTLDLLRKFKSMGVKLAIDDFGTGYSSLAYLKRFPLDVLKLDQSFVRQLCTDREDQAISQAVITLAHSLGLIVIAEGVETPEQHHLLQAMGCDEIQGFMHGRPMPAEQVLPWLEERALRR